MCNRHAEAARKNLCAKIETVYEWQQRAILFGDHISSLVPDVATEVFSLICIDAAVSKNPHAIVLAQSTFMSVLGGYWAEDHIVHTRESAAAIDDDITMTLLWVPQFPDAAQETGVVPVYRRDRELTLGERKTVARSPTRETLEKAICDPDPEVASRALDNPMLTERDVIRMCAKQSMPPSTLVQVTLHSGWRQHRVVMKTLANNKTLPACFGVTLLPFLDEMTLRQISHDRRLDDVVRTGASLLLAYMSRLNRQ